LNSGNEHAGFWPQIITVVLRARKQFDGTFAMIAVAHQNSTDACAGVFLARPLMPGDVAEMKMAHESPHTFYKAVKKIRID